MWHRPSPNAAPLCWAGANKRSEMMTVPHSSVKSVVWNSSDHSKSYLDFLDKWPDRQASCKWQTEEIICTDTAVGHREDDEFWGEEAEEDLNNSSDTTTKEHLSWFRMLRYLTKKSKAWKKRKKTGKNNDKCNQAVIVKIKSNRLLREELFYYGIIYIAKAMQRKRSRSKKIPKPPPDITKHQDATC